MNPHVTGSYLTWLRQTPEERRDVDAHLAGCPACAAYYAKMSLLLTSSGEEPRRLEPDPFLPERLRARSAPDRERHPARTALRWSMAGALAVLALAIGIELGSGLAPTTQSATTTYSTNEIVSDYYGAVSQQSFSTRLESVVPTTEEATQ